MLFSLVVLMSTALCIFIVEGWRKMIHEKIKNFNVESSRLTCADFIKRLLEKKGLNYTVRHDIDAPTGHCHYRKKEIVLSYPPESIKYLALYQAGHEAGHAFYGPGLLKKNVFLSFPVVLASFALPFYAGWKGWSETAALRTLLLIYAVIVALCMSNIISEVRASLFSINKIEQAISDARLRKLKLFVIQEIASDVLVITGLYVIWASAIWIFYKMAVYLSLNT